MTHPIVRLRTATPADVPMLRRWDQQPHVRAATGADADADWGWEAEIAKSSPIQQQLIAEADGRPIGMVQIIDPEKEETHYWGECEPNLRAIDIWIGEEADLGHGYGAEMMRLALDRCFADPGVPAVIIDPLASNERAHRFYERLGFERVGPRRFGEDDCIVMRIERVPPPREHAVPVDGARLFCREIGRGRPLVALHGGPDMDHAYLLPELGALADACRLILYDQRGRGRSADGVRAEDVGIDSEVGDLETLRAQLGHPRIALLGHSWGAVLAAEYAIRHPDRVSHLVLMNAAPVSHADFLMFRRELKRLRTPEEISRLEAIVVSEAFLAGDIAAEAEALRIHFRPGLVRPEQVEQVVARVRRHFTPAGIVLARAIEQRLQEQTWLRPEYDLGPQLGALDVPALVLHGREDFIPVGVAQHTADAMTTARLVVLENCGHFAYLERPAETHDEIAALLGNA